MFNIRKYFGLIVLLSFCWMTAGGVMNPPAIAAMSSFDVSKMSDMSDFDPNNTIFPTSGDTFKIGLMAPFSGPAADNGKMDWLITNWVVHDLNKRGGILIDGKWKKIQIIKGDTKSKPAETKKIAEKLCLEDKVDVLLGTAGSHLCLIIQNVAKKYGVIYNNAWSLSDALLDGRNFNRYTFRTCLNTTMFGKAMAYFYSQRPENKFYILCQDYSYGHSMSEAFKTALKIYKPNAEIVGEEYHPLFLKDFAPYLTKIKGSGAEVIYTGDWVPDGSNLVKQARDMGITLPIANLYADTAIETLVGPAGPNFVNGNDYMISVDTPENNAFVKKWHELWKNKWEKPYNTAFYKWPITILGRHTDSLYWMFDVIQRAGTANADKIIETWEGDEYKGLTGVLKMRADDHQVVRDVFVSDFIFPNKWHDDAASYDVPFVVPAEKCMPPVPDDLVDRRKK
jgi:branched-chain amino acid transport system substrate-binding protein